MEVSWEKAVKEAEQDLPRWRLLELEDDRPKIHDADNSALHIMAVRRKGGNVNVGAAPNYNEIFDKLPPTAQLNEQQSDLIRRELKKIGGALEEARKLKKMPRGRFPITYDDNWIGTLLPEHQGTRDVGDWLQHDAMLLADEGKCDLAVESCIAIVHGGRAMEGDLYLICLLIRIAQQQVAVATLERVLAQGQASEHALEAMQIALEHDIETSGWLAAIRGERAGCHHLFDNMRTGKISTRGFGAGLGGGGPQSFGEWLIDKFPNLMLKYYPEHLQNMNQAVEISKLPIHERGPKLEEFAKKLDLEIREKRNIVSGLMLPALVKVHNAEVRSQAHLRSAAVGLACERYRLRHKNWPASLDVLVQEKLIDAIPLDPIDGQPIRYRKTKEGIVVYSIGLDQKDNEGKIDRERPLDPGKDIGFRLWNVDQRRQPPRPPVKIEEGAIP
jgi:hypothetical protein